MDSYDSWLLQGSESAIKKALSKNFKISDGVLWRDADVYDLPDVPHVAIVCEGVKFVVCARWHKVSDMRKRLPNGVAINSATISVGFGDHRDASCWHTIDSCGITRGECDCMEYWFQRRIHQMWTDSEELNGLRAAGIDIPFGAISEACVSVAADMFKLIDRMIADVQR